MKTKKITDLAHLLIKSSINESSTVVDATMGNGFDTLFLSKISKIVYSFDIQEDALENTFSLLNLNNIHNCKLILDSHERILNYIKDFSLVVFNLGYLPKGNKNITTKSKTTLKTIKSLLEHNPKLTLVITCYPGHLEGKKESDLLLEFLKKTTYSITLTYLLNKESAPFIIKIN